MIKDFDTYIKEGRMGRLLNTDELGVRKQDELTEDIVRSYIYKGCDGYCKKVIIRYEGDKPIVDIEGSFHFRKDITEIPFKFGEVTVSFNCSQCPLTSLEGCPEKVGRDFVCSGCENLTSLEGCPQEVGGYFICSYCSNLTSLEGCPKKVGGDFDCYNCGKKFTEEEVKSLCDVKGDVLR